MARVVQWVLRCLGCGRFMCPAEVAHGGKREYWHERCAMRNEPQRQFPPEKDHAGHEQAGEDQDIEW